MGGWPYEVARAAREPAHPLTAPAHQRTGCRDVRHSPTAPVHRSGVHPMRSTAVSACFCDLLNPQGRANARG
ncbi:hypothetical protein SGLAU_00410 [Streptomyces glaucescens]|uniref:Uncharacterized protein n=1 Tax=Streptomyces glaucescens TaxID=1907 RepID=A0A089YR20_STRGA|nr:hypothetical protein SGLAU_00410 [Streptomyces glaucescens]